MELFKKFQHLRWKFRKIRTSIIVLFLIWFLKFRLRDVVLTFARGGMVSAEPRAEEIDGDPGITESDDVILPGFGDVTLRSRVTDPVAGYAKQRQAVVINSGLFAPHRQVFRHVVIEFKFYRVGPVCVSINKLESKRESRKKVRKTWKF